MGDNVNASSDNDFLKIRGQKLIESFVDPFIIRHPKGHTVPRLLACCKSGKAYTLLATATGLGGCLYPCGYRSRLREQYRLQEKSCGGDCCRARRTAASTRPSEKGEAVSLTVSRRSLLFNGKGFTVFDSNGNLVFRVETYARGSPREVVLMDADDLALLTVRRKKLSLAEEWLVYDGDGDEPAPRRFTVRRNMSLLPTKSLARLSPPPSLDGTGHAPGCRYDVQGSYATRSLDEFACTSWASVCNRPGVPEGGRRRPGVFRLTSSRRSPWPWFTETENRKREGSSKQFVVAS
ncbi:uncharacterized protein [Aegilops tauschii subsp. strangulata]|uniref:uncharacterized protein n=1 Tax=Aegilops tauschii subsp. strangulata TaxID=200361 RepID=UPI001ABC5DB3|nr:uncharacterized protein LOC120963601 [Aegilops tauschii subsp. strangulata]